MSSQMNLGKGSKRNVRRIRWTLLEILSLLLLMMVTAIISVAVAVWFNMHDIH